MAGRIDSSESQIAQQMSGVTVRGVTVSGTIQIVGRPT